MNSGSKGEDIVDLIDRLKMLARQKRQWRFVGKPLRIVIGIYALIQYENAEWYWLGGVHKSA